jgi:ribosome-binding factor A
MHIRKAPRFIFVEDGGAAYAAHIDELLKELHPSASAPAASSVEQPEGEE